MTDICILSKVKISKLDKISQGHVWNSDKIPCLNKIKYAFIYLWDLGGCQQMCSVTAVLWEGTLRPTTICSKYSQATSFYLWLISCWLLLLHWIFRWSVFWRNAIRVQAPSPHPGLTNEYFVPRLMSCGSNTVQIKDGSCILMNLTFREKETQPHL